MINFNQQSVSHPGLADGLRCSVVCHNPGLCGDVPAGVTLEFRSAQCATATEGTRLGLACLQGAWLMAYASTDLVERQRFRRSVDGSEMADVRLLSSAVLGHFSFCFMVRRTAQHAYENRHELMYEIKGFVMCGATMNALSNRTLGLQYFVWIGGCQRYEQMHVQMVPWQHQVTSVTYDVFSGS